MGIYATDGTQNVTVVDGSSFVGAYASDGSLNVFVTDGLSFVGSTHPSGAMNVTVSPGTLFCGYYAPNGSVYVTEDPTELSGALRVTVVSGSLTYDVDALAWFAAMPTEPTTVVKDVANSLILGLKEDSLWSLIDGGNFLCLETLDQGLVDFKVPTRVATTAPGFTSTFTSYRGVTGSGSASGAPDAYIEIPFNPSTAGGNWSLNSVHTLVACGNDVAGSTVEFGTNTGGDDYYHVVRNASSQFQIRSNSSSTSGIAGMASSVGITIASRTGVNAIAIYSNGSLLGNVTTQASVSVPNGNLRVLQAQSSLATTKQVTALTFGASLDATQAANLNTRVQTAISALTVL